MTQTHRPARPNIVVRSIVAAIFLIVGAVVLLWFGPVLGRLVVVTFGCALAACGVSAVLFDLLLRRVDPHWERTAAPILGWIAPRRWRLINRSLVVVIGAAVALWGWLGPGFVR